MTPKSRLFRKRQRIRMARTIFAKCKWVSMRLSQEDGNWW